MQRQKKAKKVVLGVTGSFGSGKTTVVNFFRSYGAQIIDADEIAHQIIVPAGKIYRKIIASFGRDILEKDHAINRAKLARLVFRDKRLLRRLEKIMHPEIIRIMQSRIRRSNARLIVLDAPLLLEAKAVNLADKLVVVKIDAGEQLKRIEEKTPLSKIEISRIIKAQIPLRIKMRLADFIIDNSGTKQETKKQVAELRRALWKS